MQTFLNILWKKSDTHDATLSLTLTLPHHPNNALLSYHVSIARAPTVAVMSLPLAATILPTLPLLAATSLRFLDWTICADLQLMHLAVGDPKAPHSIE